MSRFSTVPFTLRRSSVDWCCVRHSEDSEGQQHSSRFRRISAGRHKEEGRIRKGKSAFVESQKLKESRESIRADRKLAGLSVVPKGHADSSEFHRTESTPSSRRLICAVGCATFPKKSSLEPRSIVSPPLDSSDPLETRSFSRMDLSQPRSQEGDDRRLLPGARPFVLAAFTALGAWGLAQRRTRTSTK